LNPFSLLVVSVEKERLYLNTRSYALGWFLFYSLLLNASTLLLNARIYNLHENGDCRFINLRLIGPSTYKAHFGQEPI